MPSKKATAAATLVVAGLIAWLSRTPPPPPPMGCLAVTVSDPKGFPIANAQTTFAGQSLETDVDGKATYSVPKQRSTLTVDKGGYGSYVGEYDVQPTGQCVTPITMTPLAQRLPPLSDDARPNANFGSILDEHGRLMLSWFYPMLDAETQAEWRRVWKSHGLTRVVLCPIMQYRDYWVPAADWREDPVAFAGVVRNLVDQGFYVQIMLTTGDGGSAADMQAYWPGIAAAIARVDVGKWLITELGFETTGPGGGWSAAETSVGLYAQRDLFPDSWHGIELTPTRWSGASYPLQDDDPWGGCEECFYESHGGETLDVISLSSTLGS